MIKPTTKLGFMIWSPSLTKIWKIFSENRSLIIPTIGIQTAAVFEDKKSGQGRFSDICKKLLDDPKNFVPQIARKLLNFFSKLQLKNTSESDLVICTFSEGGNEKQKWLALLKMEPQSGIIQKDEEQRGKKRAILTPWRMYCQQVTCRNALL